jgi:hypothetical protein
MSQVMVQSGQGMIARHTTRILEADPGSYYSGARSRSKHGIHDSKTSKGLRIDFEQDSVDYSYGAESSDGTPSCLVNCVGSGTLTEKFGAESDIRQPGAGEVEPLSGIMSDASPTVDTISRYYPTRILSESIALLPNARTVLATPVPDASELTNWQTGNASVPKTQERSAVFDAQHVVGGVNFMLSANIRTITPNSKGDGSAALKIEGDVNFQRSLHQARFRSGQTSLTSSSEKSRQKQGGRFSIGGHHIQGFETCPNMKYQNSLSTHNIEDMRSEIQGNFKASSEKIQDLCSVISSNMGQNQEVVSPLQERIASQQRQIEALQAALLAVQAHIIPLDNLRMERNNESGGVLATISNVGRKEGPHLHMSAGTNRGQAHVETQLSSHTNSSFFNSSASRASPSASRASQTSVCGQSGGAILNEGVDELLQPNKCSTGSCISPRMNTADDRQLAADVQCPGSDGARCGDRGDAALCIFEDELVGSHQRQASHAGAFLNMSYPGAAPNDRWLMSKADDRASYPSNSVDFLVSDQKKPVPAFRASEPENDAPADGGGRKITETKDAQELQHTEAHR